MKFPARFKEEFIKELKIVKNKMKEVPNQSHKVYYFTGIGGFINRVINFDYNKELLLIDRVLFYCQARINEEIRNRINQARLLPAPPPDLLLPRNVPPAQEKQQIPEYFNPEKVPLTIINPNFFEILTEFIDELRLAVENEEDILKPIENIVELTYTLTGNGNYLLKKEIIKLDLE